MKYIILKSETEFNLLNQQMIQQNVFANSHNYASASVYKHPTKELWAFPIIFGYESNFAQYEILDNLSEDWKQIIPNKYDQR